MSPESTGKTVTREEIFDRVWKTPISKLASDFGVSDVAIAKTCKRLNVPRPPRGYWAKIEAGKRVKQPKLPPLPEGAPASAVIGAFQSNYIQKPNAVDVASLPKIDIPEDLRGCHSLVSATRKALESARPDRYDRVNSNGGRKALHSASRSRESVVRDWWRGGRMGEGKRHSWNVR